MSTKSFAPPGAPRRPAASVVSLVSLVSLASLGACYPDAGPDPTLTAYIDTLSAIDAHAHPMAWVAPGQPADTKFDALPLDGLPPFDVPVGLRADNPAYRTAQQALYHVEGTDTGAAYAAALESARTTAMAERGAGFASWALDRAHIRVMLANRIAMGAGLPAERFAWVPFADALLLPLDTRTEAARTPDTQALYPLEAALLDRYLGDLGLTHVPATLGAYERDVVAATLRKQKDAGAVGLKFEAAYLRMIGESTPLAVAGVRGAATRAAAAPQSAPASTGALPQISILSTQQSLNPSQSLSQ